MVSFLNANLPILLQLNRAEGGTLLPWPNGSLLSGRLSPAADGAGTMLMLGNYRMRIEVPPNTPMGQMWLQLLQREKPGQFRLLTDQQAIRFIADLLHKNTDKLLPNKPLPNAAMQQQAASTAHTPLQELARMGGDHFPFHVELHGQHVMLYDQKDGHTQGLVQQDQHGHGFMLHGRLDLEKLGAVAFSLEEKNGAAWKIHVHLHDYQSKVNIEPMFQRWLQERQQQSQQPLEGFLFDSIPADLGVSTTREA
ncbi:MAG: hypothetical protein Q9M19_04760 [Mariprofundaceae bacterium]|nr:hypothetical protein [Mariprofundaceae bacterium]